MNAIQPTDHTVEVNGLGIHYLDWGGHSERNLLLVHGQGGNAHNWDHVARALRDEFRVIALDQRGHGDSDHTWEGYGVDRFASDLAEFVEATDRLPQSAPRRSILLEHGYPVPRLRRPRAGGCRNLPGLRLKSFRAPRRTP